MLRTTLLALITFVLPCHTSYAQTQQESKELSDYLRSIDKESSEPFRNFTEMMVGVSYGEKILANLAGGGAALCKERLSRIGLVTMLHWAMRDNQDKDVIKQLLPSEADNAITLCNVGLQQINHAMGSLQSPSLVSEIHKVRDLYIKAVSEIRKKIPSK